MGMWDETCGVTQTPIFGGEPAVMVVLNREKLFSLYKSKHAPTDGDSLPVRIEGFGASRFDYDAVMGIYRGAYDCYGWLVGAPGQSDGVDPRRYVMPSEPSDSGVGAGFNIQIFAHENVWNEIQQFFSPEEDSTEMMEWVANFKPDTVDEKAHRELFNVCRFATLTRRDLMSGHFSRGMQTGSKAAAMYTFIADKVAQRAKKMVEVFQ